MAEDNNYALLNEEDNGDVQSLSTQVLTESKKIWYLAGPAILSSLCQYGVSSTTQIFAGQLGTTSLAAVSVGTSLIAGIPTGLMFGMSSALETYCGQAFGANKLELLGIYMQRSWVILNALAAAALPLFLFGSHVLRFLGQDATVAREGGRFAMWLIPEQFAYAIVLPNVKFLQSQSRVWVLTGVDAVALCLHVLLCWILVMKLGLGMVGVALPLNATWFFTAIAQFCYIASGSCGQAWTGFSSKALHHLWTFFTMSVASAVMMCLNQWYTMILTLCAGYLNDAEISIDAFSIGINVTGWTSLVSVGLNIASSVRVSNELGSRQARKARFSVIMTGLYSLFVGLIFSIILLVARKEYPKIFTNSVQVQQRVEQLTPLLAIFTILSNVEYALLGVAIGAGWQATVSYMSVGIYLLFGVPLGALMCFKFNMGILGLWCGMVLSVGLINLVLVWIVWTTNWTKESYAAEKRLKRWGRGST